MEFPKSIKDGDIELVKLEPTFENTKMIFDLIDKNRDFLSEYEEDFSKAKKPEDEYNYMQFMSKTSNGDYLIKYNGEIVGKAGFWRIVESSKYGELGYWLVKNATGKGIMTRAIKILENKAFSEWGFNRIEVRTDTENENSKKIMLRLNYHQDGILRQNCFEHNKFCDTLVYSKLKSEWGKENA